MVAAIRTYEDARAALAAAECSAASRPARSPQDGADEQHYESHRDVKNTIGHALVMVSSGAGACATLYMYITRCNVIDDHMDGSPGSREWPHEH